MPLCPSIIVIQCSFPLSVCDMQALVLERFCIRYTTEAATASCYPVLLCTLFGGALHSTWASHLPKFVIPASEKLVHHVTLSHTIVCLGCFSGLLFRLCIRKFARRHHRSWRRGQPRRGLLLSSAATCFSNRSAKRRSINQ